MKIMNRGVWNSKHLKKIGLLSFSVALLLGNVIALFPNKSSALSTHVNVNGSPAISTVLPGQTVQNNLNESNVTQQTNSTQYYSNWSGYADTASKPFTKVSTEYIQPSVTCPAEGAWTLFWDGLDGYDNNVVEQAGTAATCSYTSNPTPTYYAWWEMYPSNSIQVMPLTIHAGDKIISEVIYNNATNSFKLTVSDLTTLKHFTEISACGAGLNCSRQSAEWIVERPLFYSNYTYAILADWNTLSFTKSQASTDTLYKSVSSYSNTPIDMYNYQSGNILANVSKLNSAGNSFTDTWQASQ